MVLFLTLIGSAIILGTNAIAQSADSFEPIEFNVTEALLDNGVDVSAIPALAGLVERSSLSACSIAVCFAPVSP